MEIVFGLGNLILIGCIWWELRVMRLRFEEDPVKTTRETIRQVLSSYMTQKPGPEPATSYPSRPSFQEASKSYEEEYVKLMEEENAK